MTSQRLDEAEERNTISNVHGECSLWIQSGSDIQVQHLHPTANMRHPGSESQNLSHYASYGGVQFQLQGDSCICEPCYRDFSRNSHNKENQIPRWYKVQREFYNSQQVVRHHCIFCCTSQSECHCFEIQDWGPDGWYGKDNPRTWRQYLSCNGYVPHAIPNYCEHVCRSHYRRVREIIANRKCTTCSTKYCDAAWKLTSNLF
jgi:hypothetical protein